MPCLPAKDRHNPKFVQITEFAGNGQKDARIVKVEKTALPGVYRIKPVRHGDNRGFFAETYAKNKLAALGLEADFVQDNHSVSVDAPTLRGLHFQAPPRAQAKLVRCGRGALFDVAVDIRKGSPTYGQWVGEDLTAENGVQLWIPPGFAHGFVTRQPNTEIIYKCSDDYAPETEGALIWDDPAIGIDWGLGGAVPCLSAKDEAAPGFEGFDSPFNWERSV